MTKNGDVTSEATFDRDVNGDEAVIIRKTARFEAFVLYEKESVSLLMCQIHTALVVSMLNYSSYMIVFCIQNKP